MLNKKEASIKEIAEYLRVTLNHLKFKIRKGKYPTWKINNGLVEIESFKEWFKDLNKDIEYSK